MRVYVKEISTVMVMKKAESWGGRSLEKMLKKRIGLILV